MTEHALPQCPDGTPVYILGVMNRAHLRTTGVITGTFRESGRALTCVIGAPNGRDEGGVRIEVWSPNDPTPLSAPEQKGIRQSLLRQLRRDLVKYVHEPWQAHATTLRLRKPGVALPRVVIRSVEWVGEERVNYGGLEPAAEEHGERRPTG
jgi:hypothetical protein